MAYRAYSLAVLILCLSVSAFAEDVVTAPTCIRVSSASETEATIQFEPHGGEAFEAERYYGGRWRTYRASIVTTGQRHSLTVPLSPNLMNIVRVCTISGNERMCSSEGVYAKR